MIEIAQFKKFADDPKLMKKINFLEIEWRRAYPSVDLQKQIGWAHAWLVSNGKKYTDMARYLNNWFQRCQRDLEKAYGSDSPIQLPKPANGFDKYRREDAQYQEDMTLEEMRQIKEQNMRRFVP